MKKLMKSAIVLAIFATLFATTAHARDSAFNNDLSPEDQQDICEFMKPTSKKAWSPKELLKRVCSGQTQPFSIIGEFQNELNIALDFYIELVHNTQPNKRVPIYADVDMIHRQMSFITGIAIYNGFKK